MRRGIALALSLSALMMGGVGCGGDGGGEQTFDDPAFAITFKYSDEFEFADDVSARFKVGGTADGKSKGIRLDDKNGIVLQQFALTTEVTEANLERVRPELDGVVGEAAGRMISGERITAGGLPGYEYRLDVPRPVGARSRLAILFDGRTEYTVNCQSTEGKRRKVEEACQKALDTLEAK